MKADQQQIENAEGSPTTNESKQPSSSSSSSLLRRKTRDLPVLSECHACKFRIDIADVKASRLNALHSEWRIVLLCNRCFSSVESSEICSYCFAAVGDADRSFTCCECNRRVHRDCFSGFASAHHSKLSVCMDCWIPKPLASWRGVVLSLSNHNNNSSSSSSSSSSSNKNNYKRKRRSGCLQSGISVSENNVDLENVLKDANSTAEKKIEAASKAREKAVAKAEVAKRAIELATNALGLVASNVDDVREFGSTNDSQLAFQLHRAINGSPRNGSKDLNLCSVNLTWLAASKVWDCCDGGGGDQFVRASCSANGSACGRPDSYSYGEENREGLDLSLKEGEGSCSMKTVNLGGDDNGMDFESLSFCKEEESIEQNSERCESAKKVDCYLFKYQRRKKKATDLYCLKYCKRKKTTDRFFLKYSKRKTRLKAVPPEASGLVASLSLDRN